ncbi:MAG: hypothetical protein KKE73_12905 [Proteobacteria bacterium]|nr:hypothetical protein [Pseudomonadota bacterium]
MNSWMNSWIVCLIAVSLCGLCLPGLSRAEEATCKDVYQIYKTCYDGGVQMDKEGCDYLVQAMGPRLMGEEGLSGFSAALSVAMCKRGCEDGANKKKPLPMNSFRKEFCGGGLK